MAKRGPDGRYHHSYLNLSGQRLANITIADVTVDGSASFDRCTFVGNVSFDNCVFAGYLSFAEATSDTRIGFSGCRFDGPVMLDSGPKEFAHLTIAESEFDTCRELWLPRGDVNLQGVTFASGVRVVGAPRRLNLAEAVFPGGASMYLDSTDVTLFDVEFGAPSVLGYLRDLAPSSAPRLVRVWSTDLSYLSVFSTDLRFCMFVGAHNLDGFRVDSLTAFLWSPPGVRARRRVLWDEVILRGRVRPTREAWRGLMSWDESPTVPSADSLAEALAESLEDAPVKAAENAAEVAVMYRAMRKAREDAKDEPGAADFYYGEMEMRRIGRRIELTDAARRRAWAECVSAATEHTLLWLYWLISGYGLRAWRALTALVVVLLGASVIFRYAGFPGDTHTYGASLRFSVQSAMSLLRGTDEPLTPTGEWVALVLRLLGPLLFGLALLAMRGRVRR